jgi:hypothetical protein
MPASSMSRPSLWARLAGVMGSLPHALLVVAVAACGAGDERTGQDQPRTTGGSASPKEREPSPRPSTPSAPSLLSVSEYPILTEPCRYVTNSRWVAALPGSPQAREGFPKRGESGFDVGLLYQQAQATTMRSLCFVRIGASPDSWLIVGGAAMRSVQDAQSVVEFGAPVTHAFGDASAALGSVNLARGAVRAGPVVVQVALPNPGISRARSGRVVQSLLRDPSQGLAPR